MRPGSQGSLLEEVAQSDQIAALEFLLSLSQPAVLPATRFLLPLRAPLVPQPRSASVAEVHGDLAGRFPRLRIPWGIGLLLIVLGAQTGLSLRLAWSNTAFQDEALYLWAGRLEWAHWLHGTPIPPFATYFSGAPVLYPPLAAAVNAVGGLAGARILSLVFMLGATSLLWAITARLYNRRAAFFGCSAWVVLGPTQRLGAFATFDAMSLFLLALAAWCVVRAGVRGNATKWLLAAAGAALASNATKYASASFDPVVIALAGLAASAAPGRKAAAARWTAVLTYLAAGIVAFILIAGHAYSAGISATTVSRALGQQSPRHVLMLSWQWIGPIIVVGASGLALSLGGRRRQPHRTLLLGVAVTAGFLVPLEQARIHSTTSLDKHVAFGAWFVAIAAGYAADRVGSVLQSKAGRALLLAALALPLVPLAAAGASQANEFFAWPNASGFIRTLRPLAQHHSGRMLVETSSVAEYYLPASLQWKRWSNTFSITTVSGGSVGYSSKGITDAGSLQIYRKYLKRRYFSLIALNYSSAASTLDHHIAAWLRRDPAYRITASAPYGHGYYTIWQRVPENRRHERQRHRRLDKRGKR